MRDRISRANPPTAPRVKTLAERIHDHIEIMNELERIAANDGRGQPRTMRMLEDLEEQGLVLRKLARG